MHGLAVALSSAAGLGQCERNSAEVDRLDFGDHDALRIVNPWHRFANRVQHKQMFRQSPIMFYVPDHDRWDNVRSPSEKNAGAGNSRNILRFDRTHELFDRDLLLSEALCNHDRPVVPDEHHPID
jgi:hypothetical protein